MRILLFGGNGQVGTELRRSLAALGEVVATTRSGLLDGVSCETADFDQPQTLTAIVQRIAPDIVVNAAAYTAVDRAESEPQAAFRANAHAPGEIANACARRDLPLVHYSTDYVFDGRGTQPYREDDPVDPQSIYGASKLAGEQAIRASGARHLIFRTAWVYATHGHNFLKTMLRLAAERDELRVVADQIGTPTPAALIAEATAHVLRDPRACECSGTWHLTATGATSWHGFAERIMGRALAMGLIARAPKVLAIGSRDYPTPAARPGYSVLDVARFSADFGLALPSWQDGLEKTLARDASDGA